MNVKRLLEETEKQRRAPGISFLDGAAGRRARIAGTGIEVFEVIGDCKAAGGDRAKAREAFHWLSDRQFDAALAHCATLYPEGMPAYMFDELHPAPETG
jgi:uncharacterized protein (DUF433 family)